jgi:hypothetical protein
LAGAFSSIQIARVNKTRNLFENKSVFMASIFESIKKHVKESDKLGFKPCVRLNGTSDLSVENWKFGGDNIMGLFPDVMFYDYTKNPYRMARFLEGKMPENYHLTFSRSESNDDICDALLAKGGNIAVVFDKVPSKWKGCEVIDGDLSDLRFLDKSGVIVGLKAKKDAIGDKSGFVVYA